jgi:hypothetical protein
LDTGQVAGKVTVPIPAPAIDLFLSGAKRHPDKSPASIGLDGVDSDGVRIAATAGRLLHLWLQEGLMGARVKALASDHVAWCIGYSRASRRHFFANPSMAMTIQRRRDDLRRVRLGYFSAPPPCSDHSRRAPSRRASAGPESASPAVQRRRVKVMRHVSSRSRSTMRLWKKMDSPPSSSIPSAWLGPGIRTLSCAHGTVNGVCRP